MINPIRAGLGVFRTRITRNSLFDPFDSLVLACSLLPVLSLIYLLALLFALALPFFYLISIDLSHFLALSSPLVLSLHLLPVCSSLFNCWCASLVAQVQFLACLVQSQLLVLQRGTQSCCCHRPNICEQHLGSKNLFSADQIIWSSRPGSFYPD